MAIRIDSQIYAACIYNFAAFFIQILYQGFPEARVGKNDDYWLTFAFRATRNVGKRVLSTPYIYDQELLYLRIGRDKSIFRRTGHLLDASHYNGYGLSICYYHKTLCHNFVTSTVPDSHPKTIVLVAFMLKFYKT